MPIEADNLSNLCANKGHLFFARSGAPFYGRESERKTALMAFSFEKREASVVVDDIGATRSHVLGEMVAELNGSTSIPIRAQCSRDRWCAS